MQEMKSRVAEYFATRNVSSKANAAMVVKTLSCLQLPWRLTP